MSKSQIIAFLKRTQRGLLALQNFSEGYSTLLCKSERGLGIMLLEISRAFLWHSKRLPQKRTPLFPPADCAHSRSALKESGPSRESVDANRTMQHHSFAFGGLSSAGRKLAEVCPQRRG